MMKKLAYIAIGALPLLAACAEPGGFTGELEPVNVAGHDVRTVMASAWMNECLGGRAIMLTQFEHVPGDRHLRHLGSGTVLTPGDCTALINLVGQVGAATILADGIRDGGDTFDFDATASTSVDVDVNS